LSLLAHGKCRHAERVCTVEDASSAQDPDNEGVVNGADLEDTEVRLVDLRVEEHKRNNQESEYGGLDGETADVGPSVQIELVALEGAWGPGIGRQLTTIGRLKHLDLLDVTHLGQNFGRAPRSRSLAPPGQRDYWRIKTLLKEGELLAWPFPRLP
jgi:hypothetical protein